MLPGSGLSGSLEMPHVEKNVSSHYYDSSVEPCLKKLKPDTSPLHTGQDAAKHKQPECNNQLLTLDFIPLDVEEEDDEYSEIEGCENKSAAVNDEFRNSTGVTFPNSAEHLRFETASSNNNSFKASNNIVIDYEANKRSNKGYFFDTGKGNTRSAVYDDHLSETSNAFIGPVFRPPPKEENKDKYFAIKHSNCNRVESPCYKINTVELRKATRSSSKNEIDYELRQFYKELEQLTSETDDQPAKGTEQQLEVAQSRFSSTRTSVNESLVENNVTSYNKQPFHEEQTGWREHNLPDMANSYSFINRTMPPPTFQPQPPHSFIMPYGPPPPTRYNFPFVFPRQGTSPCIPHPQNVRPSGGCEIYQKPSDHNPWNRLSGPVNGRYNDQGVTPRMWPPQDSSQNRQQDLNNSSIGGDNHSHFNLACQTPGAGISHERYPDNNSVNSYKKKLVLLRGLPGSGKTTLARNILEQCRNGIVFSTDDYFCQKEGYTYDVKLLGDAHIWNQNRARRAMDDGKCPVIIDNTNTQSWEMKPYVQMAMERGYIVDFLEPDTWWKLDPLELEKRNKHGVPREKISQMLERYEYDMTIPVVMNSVEPPHKSAKRHHHQTRQRWEASVNLSDFSSFYHNQ
ncbi:NEDD4-binding protein 2-like 2 [Discoglossus pictus]